MGYLRTMFHYFLCVTVSPTHLLCAGNFFAGLFFPLRKHTYLRVQKKKSTVVPVSTQTHTIVLLNQKGELFPFSACTHVVLGTYFLAEMLKKY